MAFLARLVTAVTVPLAAKAARAAPIWINWGSILGSPPGSSCGDGAGTRWRVPQAMSISRIPKRRPANPETDLSALAHGYLNERHSAAPQESSGARRGRSRARPRSWVNSRPSLAADPGACLERRRRAPVSGLTAAGRLIKCSADRRAVFSGVGPFPKDVRAPVQQKLHQEAGRSSSCDAVSDGLGAHSGQTCGHLEPSTIEPATSA